MRPLQNGNNIAAGVDEVLNAGALQRSLDLTGTAGQIDVRAGGGERLRGIDGFLGIDLIG